MIALLLPLAHLGHWYGEMIFGGPALLVLGYMGWGSLRRRQRERRARRPQ